jgi:hypothetical protein
VGKIGRGDAILTALNGLAKLMDALTPGVVMCAAWGYLEYNLIG